MSQINAVLAGMQTSLQYDHFKGALYPLTLDCVPAQKVFPIKSLVQIASDYIVKDATMTLSAIEVMPQEVFTVLLQQALEGNRDRAVDVLLTKWPLPTLSLKKFAPNIFTNLGLLHSQSELIKVAKQGLRYTTCIAHNFLETLKRKCDTRLKVVDISGYPTAEVITYYLATHCMLAHNEARQNMMIRKYEEAVKLLPENEACARERFTTDQSLPDDNFVVKLDVFISSEASLYELCKALKVSGFQESTLKLIVNKLDATCLGAGKVEILLEQLNPEFLHGLSLKFNSINSEELSKLCPLLRTLTNLTILDLSGNMINLSVAASDTCVNFTDTLGSLGHLVRLDLSNNIVRGNLRRVLSAVVQPLQYLSLEGCGLSPVDIAYLSVSHHSASVCELLLSNNNLRQSLSSLMALLRNLKTSLKLIQLENCSFSNENCSMLSESMKRLTSVVYLDLQDNLFSLNNVYQLGVSLACLETLQYLRVSYPTDSYHDDPEVQNQSQKEFVVMLGELIYREKQRLHQNEKTLSVIFCHLPHVHVQI
ncbi:leucine-rich repeat-containing protein 14-like isoform X2 [Dreissena polymorpha]|uniref:leucine-rich repeat-containing protein 14-like isoform X2 n=1 Tax=Dreissena polymorpha TaxID=45954 RepID=UPI0022645751|nr:leucine-rich repeat-containing protein 14-like isoform X2 [Dreissena polymorpha]